MSTEIFIIDNQPYEVKATRIINKDGSLYYKCELLGTSISTFAYNKNYDGISLEEALQKIASELRRSLDEISDY